MKRKLLTALLALALVLGLCGTALAEPAPEPAATPVPNGTVTVTVPDSEAEPSQNVTYTFYKIFDLTYDSSKGAYAYTLADGLEDKYNAADSKLAAVIDKYFEVDKDNGYAITARATYNTEAAAKELASALMADDVKTLLVDSENTTITVAAGDTSASKKLDYGYWLMDSTVGSLFSLDSNAPTVELKDKNEVPGITKEVQNATKTAWEDSSSKLVGEVETFRVTLDVKAGAQNYAIVDTMTEGLTLSTTAGDWTYEWYDVDSTAEEKTKKLTDAEIEDYIELNITPDLSKGETWTFKMTFKDKFYEDFADGDYLRVTYKATVNEKAVHAASGTEGEDGYLAKNTSENDVYVEYGNDLKTEEDTVTVKVFDVDLVKYYKVTENNESKNKLLSGAEFALYIGSNTDKSTSNLTQLKFIYDADNQTYTVATGDQIKDNNVTTTSTIKAYDDNGTPDDTSDDKAVKVTIKGLEGRMTNGHSQSYTLVETATPEGFTTAENYVFSVSNTDMSATLANENTEYTSGGVAVENKSGSELPSTGGIGTTIFYVVGGLLMAGAVVLLVTRKKMSANNR